MPYRILHSLVSLELILRVFNDKDYSDTVDSEAVDGEKGKGTPFRCLQPRCHYLCPACFFFFPGPKCAWFPKNTNWPFTVVREEGRTVPLTRAHFRDKATCIPFNHRSWISGVISARQ